MKLVYLEDYYYAPDGNMVFTEAYHLKRGFCCGSDCMHCPFDGISVLDSNSAPSDTAIQCPFCFETFSIPLHAEEGIEQSFIYDCEVCCHPIDISVNFIDPLKPVVTWGRSN